MTRLCRTLLGTALSLLVLPGLGCGGSSERADPVVETEDGGREATADESDSTVPAQVPPAKGGATDAGRVLDGGVSTRGPTDTGIPSDASRGPEPAQVDAQVPVATDAGTKPKPTTKFVGNITTKGQVRGDFAMFWDQITPENEGKWGSVEPARNQMNWAGVDRVHTFAKQNGLVFKQHTFVWGSQQPGWLASLSAAEQRAEVEEWIRLFCERYPDVDVIDVVNEPPPHTTPVYMQALGGAGASGYDWIVQSFKWARQYCPKAVLVLNDYNNIEYTGDATHFIDIAKKVKAAGAPIDAVGAQAHDAHKLPTDTVKKFIDQLSSETGLPVYITEYDINQGDEGKQADVMKSQFSMFYSHKAVQGITLWGYVSGATWQPNTGLMSESGQQRAAMKWLLEFLHR